MVALAMVPGVGPTRVRGLLARFGSATAVLSASARQLATVDGIGRQTAEAIARFDDDEAVAKQFAQA